MSICLTIQFFNFWEILNKPPLESCIVYGVTNFLLVSQKWWIKFFNNFNLDSIRFYFSFWDLVASHYLYHEMTLFPIEYKILLFTLLQNLLQISRTSFKRFSRNQEVIHEYLHECSYHVYKDGYHTSLKFSWSIT